MQAGRVRVVIESPGGQVVMEGDGTRLDPADPADFIAAAGEQFLGTGEDGWHVRAGDGSEQVAHPGWVAVPPDGGGPVRFLAADLVP